MFGRSATIDLLIAHKDAKQQDPRSPPESPRSSARQKKTKPLSKAEFGTENLLFASSGIPPLQASELIMLKQSIIQRLGGRRIYIVIDPVSNVIGPLGDPMHDASTLLLSQDQEPTAELRFTLNRMEFSIVPLIFRMVAKYEAFILATRLNEAAGTQLNVVVASKVLTEDVERNLLDDLQQLFKERKLTGAIELMSLQRPGFTQVRNVSLEDEEQIAIDLWDEPEAKKDAAQTEPSEPVETFGAAAPAAFEVSLRGPSSVRLKTIDSRFGPTKCMIKQNTTALYRLRRCVAIAVAPSFFSRPFRVRRPVGVASGSAVVRRLRPVLLASGRLFLFHAPCSGSPVSP